MAWYKRDVAGILTPTHAKKEMPEGLWYKCSSCSHVATSSDHEQAFWVCTACGYHEKIGSKAYFSILFDDNQFEELFPNLTSADPLNFVDTKKYTDRYLAAQKTTGLKDAITCAHGKIEQMDWVVACMDFSFIGGSMGAVVGEKIARSIDYCIAHKLPLLIISKSGGARMMGGSFFFDAIGKNISKIS